MAELVVGNKWGGELILRLTLTLRHMNIIPHILHNVAPVRLHLDLSSKCECFFSFGVQCFWEYPSNPGTSASCTDLLVNDHFCSMYLPITNVQVFPQDCQYENLHAQQCVDFF